MSARNGREGEARGHWRVRGGELGGVVGAIQDVTFFDAPKSDQIRELVAYWERKRGNRFAPSRADIDPVDIPGHLPDLLLIDVLDGGADFRYRLIGTRFVEGMGRDYTNRRVSEVYADQPRVQATIQMGYGSVVRARRPVFGEGRVFWLPQSDFRHFEGALLPLSSDGIAVDIIILEILVSWRLPGRSVRSP